MNREIKFRAWIPTFNKLETGLFGLRSDGKSSFNSEAILMQYTGYKDKKGVEIYEGDILLITSTDEDKKNGYNDFTELVYFSFGSFRVTEGKYDISLTTEPEGSFNELGECFSEDCVVIGNMYQNPELHNNPPVL